MLRPVLPRCPRARVHRTSSPAAGGGSGSKGPCAYTAASTSPWKESLAADDLVDSAVLLRLDRAEFLAAQQKVPTTNLPDDLRPHDVQAVARHDAKSRMRCVLRVRVLGSKHDVTEKGVLGVGGHRAVDRGDHRHLDVEKVLEDFGALAEDLVVACRCEKVETLGRELRAELVPGPRQDD